MAPEYKSPELDIIPIDVVDPLTESGPGDDELPIIPFADTANDQ